MRPLIATRKTTTGLFAMAWLACLSPSIGYGQPLAEAGKIYWTNSAIGIQRANLDGSNLEQLVEPDLRRPAEIAVDLLRGKIYWTDNWNIYYSDLDGSNLKPFIAFVDHDDEDFNRDLLALQVEWMEEGVNVASGVVSIALDVLGGKIYWISLLPGYDYGDGHVARADLDGSNSEIIDGYRSVGDLALDADRGNVYYAGSGRYIIRTDLDGQNLEDFRIHLSDYSVETALDLDGGKIYWTSQDMQTIQRADLDGQNIEEVLAVSDGYPEQIALDMDRGKIYWTNPSTQTIQRADLDGQNIEILFSLQEDALYSLHQGPRIGIALDVEGGKIYWADSRQRLVQRADLNGQNVETLFDPIVKQPHGIALHLDKMYWTDAVKGTIQRADLDGQNLEVLIRGLNSPRDIALLAGGKIYWASDGKIQRADLDGSNVESILTDLSHLGDIALDGVQGKIYWRESHLREQWEHTIQRADLDGQSVETIIVSEASRMGKIALDILAGKIYWIELDIDDQNVQTMRRAGLDGSNVETIVVNKSSAWDYYGALALDLTGNKIYWSARGSGIWRHGEPSYYWAQFFWSNLDGSNLEDIWMITIQDYIWTLQDTWTLYRGTSIVPTDLALDISHSTSISTPVPTSPTPTTSGLSPNYPNPFNASTQIAYHLATAGPVRLTIYNILGQPVHTLVDQFQAAGSYQVGWDARDAHGTLLAAGVYLVRLHYPGGEQTRRLLLLK